MRWFHNRKTKEGSEIWMQGKNLDGVVAATTLGDTLVEYQLLCFISFATHGLCILGSIDSLCRLLWLPHLPHGHTWFTFYQLSQTHQNFQLDNNISKSGRVVWFANLRFAEK